MKSIKSLVRMASLLVFYKCHKIIEHFIAKTSLCERHQGCQTKIDWLLNTRYYCCICCVLNHCTIDGLDMIKKNCLKLMNFYLNLLKDLEEI